MLGSTYRAFDSEWLAMGRRLTVIIITVIVTNAYYQPAGIEVEHQRWSQAAQIPISAPLLTSAWTVVSKYYSHGKGSGLLGDLADWRSREEEVWDEPRASYCVPK